ncbi:uncharacterized protein LOC108202185 isoform X2 [Daucus carota subsp. sativus]|uniref:uncharacterized protein LOC108202185 isoform X2 n=1 Tax=Daucus carota subsp. sativus TaxID=79200 RepID=UPI003083E8EF
MCILIFLLPIIENVAEDETITESEDSEGIGTDLFYNHLKTRKKQPAYRFLPTMEDTCTSGNNFVIGQKRLSESSDSVLQGESKRKGRGQDVDTIFRRQNIVMFGESTGGSALLKTG